MTSRGGHKVVEFEENLLKGLLVELALEALQLAKLLLEHFFHVKCHFLA